MKSLYCAHVYLSHSVPGTLYIFVPLSPFSTCNAYIFINIKRK